MPDLIDRAPIALQPSRVDLWVAIIEDARQAGALPAYRGLLSPQEGEQAAGFRFAKHRERFLVTRALVRTVLSRYAELPPSAWGFDTTPQGRPFLLPQACAPAGITFNLSHTDELVILAIGQHRALGVDMESPDRQARRAVMARWFTAAERAAFAGLPVEQRTRRFIELWTLKESYVKASGEGLSFPLDQLDFDLGVPGVVSLKLLDDAFSPSAPPCQFWQLALPAGHVGAVCTSTGPDDEATSLSLCLTVPLHSDRSVEPSVLRHPPGWAPPHTQAQKL